VAIALDMAVKEAREKGVDGDLRVSCSLSPQQGSPRAEGQK